MNNKLIIMYDYDGTLASGNIQEPFLLPLLMPECNGNPRVFWERSNTRGKQLGIDSNSAYMQELLEASMRQKIPLTYELLRKAGSYSSLFPGVDKWFARINNYAKKRGIEIMHYVISAGNYECILGSPIAKYLNGIYACKFIFDDKGHACGVGTSINSFQKLQCIDEIRTPEPLRNNLEQNEEDKIPYRNMIYIGDGTTDVPAMREMINHGGYSFKITNPRKEEESERFLKANVAHGAFRCDEAYISGGGLTKAIYPIINNLGDLLDEEKVVQLSVFDYNDDLELIK